MRRIAVGLAGGALLAAGMSLSPVLGATPSTGAVTVPSAVGHSATVTYSGTIVPGNITLNDCTDPTTVPDVFKLTIKAPATTYKKLQAVFTFAITWKPTVAATVNDEALELFAPNGTAIQKSDQVGTTAESLTQNNLPSGTYSVEACGSTNASSQDYTATISVKTIALPKANAPGASFTTNDSFETFTPATIVDPILFGGEPGFNFDPTTNGSREFVDWPVSSRTNIGVFFRSTDGGLSFQKRYADVTDVVGEDGPACLGRQVPYCASGGGGDTDTSIDPVTGHIYFSSQESLANEATGASFDHGTTFPASNVDPVTHKAGGDVDRQWLGFWKGTNTVFLEYHSPVVGAYVLRSDKAGATGSWYLPATGTPVGPPSITGVTQSGAMEVDNTGGIHNHTIYVAYLAFIPGGAGLIDESLHIGVSTDGAKSFTSYKIPGGNAARNFTKIYLDTAGNLYAVWTDSQTQATYLATSLANVGGNRAHPGSVWKGPYQISTAPAKVTIFPDVRAGSPGRIAVIYYGTSADASTPDDVKPNTGGWYPYVAVSTNALCMWSAHPCTSPTFHQTRIAHKVNHNDNICTSGTACAATGGNRNLLDYFDIDMDRQGHLGFVWSDTTNGVGEPFVKVSRQATGPSLFAGQPAAHLSMRYNGYPDAAGDAKFPIAGATINTAKNHPTLDLRGTSVAVKGKNLEFTIRLTSAANLGAGVPTGADGLTQLQQAKYLVRWDYGLAAYYAGANVPAGSGAKPAFFSGTVSKAEGINSPTNPDNLQGFGNIYSALGPATGHVAGNSLVIDVPRSAVGNPSKGARLVSVGSYTMVGEQDANVILETLPITVDSSPTFDTVLTSAPAASPGSATPGSSAPASTSAGGNGGSLAKTGGSAALSAFGALLLFAALFMRRRRSF